jgi:CubicO group peptidase (beta-lactamase class C family)
MSPLSRREMSPSASDGFVAAGFEPVRSAFDRVLADRPTAGAAVTVCVGNEVKVDLWGGPTYRRASVQLLFSVTKSAAAICALMAHDRGLLDLDAPVASIWPAFGRAGKDSIPVRWLLTHQAGVPTVDRRMSFDDVLAGEPWTEALEVQAPYWAPGTAHGYHVLTMGYLISEVLRRATGMTVGQFFATEVAAPLGLDFWIGLPADVESRVVPIQLADGQPEDGPYQAALRDRTSLAYRVMSNPSWGPFDFDTPAFHAAEVPAANGIASARSLARLYAACVTEVDGIRLLTSGTLERACVAHADGFDLINHEINRFGLGFYLPSSRLPMGGRSSFGHDGSGGSLGFADRESGLSYGFTTDLIPVDRSCDPANWPIVPTAMKCLRA